MPAARGPVLLIALMATLFGACKQEKKGTVIARVGNVELTREEAVGHIGTIRGTSEQQLNAYVASWINDELIYQEAIRTRMDQSEDIDRRLLEVRRQIVDQRFLERYIYTDSIEFKEQSLRDYYDGHLTEFLLREDMVKMHMAIFATRERASAFTSRLAKTSDWNIALADSSFAHSIVTSAAPGYQSLHTLFPAELWKIAITLSVGEVSFPVKTATGYAVIQPLVVVRQGKPTPFDLARDEVLQRLIIEQRRKNYEQLLGTLRKRYAVEVFTSTMQPSDTTRQDTHE